MILVLGSIPPLTLNSCASSSGQWWNISPSSAAEIMRSQSVHQAYDGDGDELIAMAPDYHTVFDARFASACGDCKPAWWPLKRVLMLRRASCAVVWEIYDDTTRRSSLCIIKGQILLQAGRSAALRRAAGGHQCPKKVSHAAVDVYFALYCLLQIIC